MISSAVGSERVSRVVGYKLRKGNFKMSSDNLPQRILILGQPNTANEASLDTTPYDAISHDTVGKKYGYGSMLHQIMRILRPVSDDGVGGIPTVIYPQKAAVGATATVITATLTIAAAATDSATHYAVINGRDNIDGIPYAYAVEKGDTTAKVYVKIKNAINSVPGSPVIATTGGTAGSESSLILTSKWKGKSSTELSLRFDIGDKSCGITYSSSKVDGAGAIDISDALEAAKSVWNTIVINPYGADVFDTLETFNGIPDPENPTGRYGAIVFKPFISIWGSTESDSATIAAITDARKLQVTHALAPAPGSEGFSWEAAANMTYLFSRMSQDYPHLDICGKAYPDMPVPSDENIGDMADYNYRDSLVKKGASTVDIIGGSFVVQDFVTTYHPDGENPAQFRYCRNLMLDFNVRYGYFILEQAYVIGRAITNDDMSVSVSEVIKPKDWKQVLNSYADDLASRALSADSEFMRKSIVVGISSNNPDRFETFFRYKRTGTVRIASTDAEAGFNFGSN